MGLCAYVTRIAFGGFGGCRGIAENADADMRDREKLAFENARGV